MISKETYRACDRRIRWDKEHPMDDAICDLYRAQMYGEAQPSAPPRTIYDLPCARALYAADVRAGVR